MTKKPLTDLKRTCLILSRGLFHEGPSNFSGPERCFLFATITFEIKVSIILKTIKWNYQFTKQNWVAYEQELCCYSTGVEFKICLHAQKVSWHFEKRAPGGNSVLSQSGKNHQKNTYLKFTLPQLNKDHMKGNDKQDHVQTWEFWCDNTVHTKRYNQSVRKVQCTWCILFTVI